MPESFPGIANVHLDALEHGDEIVFMHAVKNGPASQSYGLQVAKLAGIPKEVVNLAKRELQSLEKKSLNQDVGQSAKSVPENSTPQTDLFAINEPSELEQMMDDIEPDELSPRDALDAIYKLKRLSNRSNWPEAYY